MQYFGGILEYDDNKGYIAKGEATTQDSNALNQSSEKPTNQSRMELMNEFLSWEKERDEARRCKTRQDGTGRGSQTAVFNGDQPQKR